MQRENLDVLIRTDDIPLDLGEPVELSIKNDSPFRISAYVMETNGEEVFLQHLSPNSVISQNTLAGTPHFFRQEMSGKLVAIYLPDDSTGQKFTIDFNSGNKRTNRAITFINDTLLEIDLARMTEKGVEE